jgi:hypothetical protein
MDKSITRAERGVLPTHEYVAAREMLLHLYEEQAEDGSDDSEDEDSSSSDDDDDLDLSSLFSDSDSDDSDSDDEDGSDTDEELEDMLFDAVIAHMDATKRGAPSLYPASMWVKEPWNHMEAGEFERWTNFTPDEIIRLDSLLTRCPATIIGSGSFGRYLPRSRLYALTIYTMRLSGRGIARPWEQIAMRLTTSVPFLTNIFSQFAYVFASVDHGYDTLATNVDVVRIQGRVEEMVNAAKDLGCKLENFVFGADGSEGRTCRPHRKFGNDMQQAVYQGRSHIHGVTKHDLSFHDGTIVTYIGSAADHDTRLLTKSGQMEAIECLYHPRNGKHVTGFGDQAYYKKHPLLIARPKGAISKRKKAWYRTNNIARAATECNFKEQYRLWPFLQHRKELKLKRQSRYSVKDLFIGVTILTNAYVCLNGSQATGLFGVDPPSLEDYFENANANRIPIMRP